MTESPYPPTGIKVAVWVYGNEWVVIVMMLTEVPVGTVEAGFMFEAGDSWGVASLP